MKAIAPFAQLFTRLILAIGFFIPVADRFGWLGAPGTGIVSWGNWSLFLQYTHSLLPFLSSGLADVFGLFATVLEIAFGILLLIGFNTRYAALGTALLTFTFACCMIGVQGIAAPFKYPVFVYTSAGLLLCALGEYRWSIDEYLSKKKS